MARKKITPEEKAHQTAAVDEIVATGSEGTVQDGLVPNGGEPTGSSAEAVPAAGPDGDIGGRRVDDSVLKERMGEDAESAAAEMPMAEAPAAEAPVPEEGTPVEETTPASEKGSTTEKAAAQPVPDDAVSAAVESVMSACAGGKDCSSAEEDVSNVNMTPGAVPDLYETASELPEYSIDLSEEPEAMPPRDAASPDAEADDWGFQEPRMENAVEVLPAPPSVSVPPRLDEQPEKVAKSDRQLFYELEFNKLDRGLTPEERQEWNSIYASYRGRSALTGKVIGVDPLSVYVWNPRTERKEKLTMYCAVVVPYRVRIVIPQTEMWEDGEERPDYVLQNMVGANIDFIIIKVEREAGFAIASRRLASRSQRYFFAHREDLHCVGARVKCRTLVVGPRRCLVDCYGHDIDLTQREMRYAAIPDLRDEYHAGMELDCIVKAYDPEKDKLVVSVKEIEINPFIGAEQRHPIGSRRLAVIAGKYGGGVFCNLPDGTVCMCNYSYQHEDSDFVAGENVMLVVQRYDNEKRQMFGKIMSKW